MIVVVSLNPSIDRTVELDSFCYGGMNRVRRSFDVGAGKAINVAVAAAVPSMDLVCIGLLPRDNGDLITSRLSDRGCSWDFLPVDGAVRINTKIVDRATGLVTELNEAGVEWRSSDQEAVKALVSRYRDPDAFFVFTGRLPPGCPVDFYRQLMELCGGHCVVDAEGEALLSALDAKPCLIKPNLFELENTVGRPLPTREDIVAAALELTHRGAGLVAVSLGKDGAILTDGSQTVEAAGIPVVVRSTVGAGDSMVAGMVLAMHRGLGIEDILHAGIAAGTAACI